MGVTDEEKVKQVTAKLVQFRIGDRVLLNPTYAGIILGTIVGLRGFGCFAVRPNGFGRGFSVVRHKRTLTLL